MILKSAALGLAALLVSGGAALAWDDAYKGSLANDPNSNFRYNSVPGVANLCPAGTQPVQIGGEICCGVPNAGPYIDRAGGQPLSHAGSTAGYYAPEGVKGVVRR